MRIGFSFKGFGIVRSGKMWQLLGDDSFLMAWASWGRPIFGAFTNIVSSLNPYNTISEVDIIIYISVNEDITGILFVIGL